MMHENRRVKVFSIEGRALFEALQLSGILRGLPEDAVLIGVRDDFPMNGIAFAVTSEEFDVVSDYESAPRLHTQVLTTRKVIRSIEFAIRTPESAARANITQPIAQRHDPSISEEPELT
jgi:hypothetical protein